MTDSTEIEIVEKVNPFGNLSFSNYTLETVAERCLLALQAALKVRGYTDLHPTWKSILRLKRSMERNKIKRYSFNLVHVTKDAVAAPVLIVPDLDHSEVLTPILEKITGLILRSKESKVTSSGHFTVKFVLEGDASDCHVEPSSNLPATHLLPSSKISCTRARGAVASTVFKECRNTISSFSVQPFYLHVEKTRITLTINCIYKGPDGQEA